MARPDKQAAKNEADSQSIADGIFAGIDPKRAAEIAAHFESKIAQERKNLDALLEEATAAAAANAQPQPESATELTPENIVGALGQMQVGVGHCLEVLHAKARSAIRAGDHPTVTRYSRLATVFGEFSNAITEFIASHPK